jgi:hypothetical protein
MLQSIKIAVELQQSPTASLEKGKVLRIFSFASDVEELVHDEPDAAPVVRYF